MNSNLGRSKICVLLQKGALSSLQKKTGRKGKCNALTESEEDTNSAGSALRVFDLEKQEWRSFRWDSVKQFTIGI